MSCGTINKIKPNKKFSKGCRFVEKQHREIVGRARKEFWLTTGQSGNTITQTCFEVQCPVPRLQYAIEG
jgi:hypothetical protein